MRWYIFLMIAIAYLLRYSFQLVDSFPLIPCCLDGYITPFINDICIHPRSYVHMASINAMSIIFTGIITYLMPKHRMYGWIIICAQLIDLISYFINYNRPFMHIGSLYISTAHVMMVTTIAVFISVFNKER